MQSIQNVELVRWLSILNPLLVLLGAYREVLMSGQMPDLTSLYWVFAESVALLVGALWSYAKLNCGGAATITQ